MEKNIIKVEKLFCCQKDRLIEAFTNPEILKQWAGKDAFFENKEGGCFSMIVNVFLDGAKERTPWTVTASIEKIIPSQRFLFGWLWAHEEDRKRTPVTIQFETVSNTHSKILLTHDISEKANACEDGWSSLLNKLYDLESIKGGSHVHLQQ